MTSERQSEALRAIQAFTGEHGYPPTYRQLGELIGLSSSASVQHVVRALLRDGRVEHVPHSPRTLREPQTGSYVPELEIVYEDIPGWWQVLDTNADPPRCVGDHFPTRKEAEAYRMGWWDGWAWDVP